MTLAKLTSLVPPPSSPPAYSENTFLLIEKNLKIKFPNDYKEFTRTYGRGQFFDDNGLAITIFNPCDPDYRASLSAMLDAFMDIKDETTFDVFPHVPGLFPWGADDAGGNLFWLVDGPAETWPVLTTFTREISFERYDMTMSTFLESCFSGKMLCKIWRDQFISGKGVRFIV